MLKIAAKISLCTFSVRSEITEVLTTQHCMKNMGTFLVRGSWMSDTKKESKKER